MNNRATFRFNLMAATATCIVAAFVLAACSGPSPAQQPATQAITLDPELFGGEVRQAYEIARANPELLAQLHCYCGCDREIGHRNLLDCFRDRHGGQCKICVAEAIEGARLYKEGEPAEQIRDALRAHYDRES